MRFRRTQTLKSLVGHSSGSSTNPVARLTDGPMVIVFRRKAGYAFRRFGMWASRRCLSQEPLHSLSTKTSWLRMDFHQHLLEAERLCPFV